MIIESDVTLPGTSAKIAKRTSSLYLKDPTENDELETPSKFSGRHCLSLPNNNH